MLPDPGNRQADSEGGSAPIAAIGRNDSTTHRFNKPSRDGKTQPGAGAHLIRLLRPVKLVEDVIEIAARNAASLVEDLQTDGASTAPTPDPNGRFWWRILRGVVEEIEQDLLEQHRIKLEHWQIRRELKLDLVVRKYAAGAPQGATDDLAKIVRGDVGRDSAGFELGHVQEVGDEAVKPFRLVDDGP